MQNQKPMYTSSIVHVKAGETIPAALLAKLVSENQTAVGMVVREPDKLVVEKFLEQSADRLTMMAKLNEGTKKYPRMFVFHAYPTEHDEDEIMPWTVLKDSKNNPILVIAIEGDFPQHVDAEFCEAYNLLDKWLAPKVEAMYKLIGNNQTKLFEYFHTEQFKADFKNVLGHRGTISFMPTIGDPFIIEHNELGIVSTWGSASNAYGYTESAIEAATVEKKPEPAKAKSKYLDDEPEAAPKPTSDPPRADPATTKDPIEKVAEDIVEYVDWSPPKGLHGKPLKAAIRAVNGGVLVDNWRDEPLVIRVKLTKKAAAAKKADTAVVKDMKAPAPEPSKPLTLPVFSGVQQAAAVNMIKKHLGDGSLVITDPIEAQQREQKHAPFSKLVLLSGKLDETERWTPEFIAKFVKENSEAAYLMILEQRSVIRRLKEALAAEGKTLGELTGTDTTTKPTPGTAAPASPAQTPSPDNVEKRISKYA